MKYISTRGQTGPVSFTEAVAIGLAPDGGLFLPESLPRINGSLKDWEALSYAELSYAFFKLFATDMEAAVLQRCIASAYKNFDHPKVAPVRRLDEKSFVLELFYGPTLAFKDFALQLLGNLYEEQIRQTGIPINVLGATSGDTGAAAIHGLLGKEGVNIFILYPDGRISALQERQMTCTGAANVFPLAIKGSFDDAQRALKETFEDRDFKESFQLSAVNSINLARILAQCVYYIFGWLQMPSEARDNVEVIVPTGNFGNIFAGWLSHKMGLPVKSFRVATNQNDILYRLFRTGHYELDKVQPSLAPSMDIQVASNFERFLYYGENSNSERVREIMARFRQTGAYHFDTFNTGIFTTSRTTDPEIIEIIQRVYRQHNYIIDPHTACGFKEPDPPKNSLILSTAHPAKFPETITRVIGQEPKAAALEKLKERKVVKYSIPAEKAAIQSFIREHSPA